VRSGCGRLTLTAPSAIATGVPTSADWDTLARRLADIPAQHVDAKWDVPLAMHTTLRIGGPARVLARVLSRDGVASVLSSAGDAGVPWMVLGLGANLLVPDEGIEAVVLQLDGELATVEVDGTRLRAGGGAPWAKVVRASIDAGLAGIECLGGIPSSLGGALAMNAGAYGQEVLDVLAWADVVAPDGTPHRLGRAEIEGGYRWSVLGRGRIVTCAELALSREDPVLLKDRARQARSRRLAALPSEPSAGSVFRNPPGEFAGRLLEQAGCKGLANGGAQVSGKHANVIVNLGGARAADVRALIVEMARRVRERNAVRLTLELKVLGRDASVLTDPEAL